MDAQKAHYPLALMCRVLGVCRSGYYAWRERLLSRRHLEDQVLAQKVKDVFAHSRQSYGSPRVHAALRAEGFMAGRHRIARLMRQAGLVARGGKRRHPGTTDSNHSLPVADNLLARQFDAIEPDTKWVTDITYLPSPEGWLYLVVPESCRRAVIIDLFSRRVVGWSMAAHLQTELVLTALQSALGKRLPCESGLMFHSDRGGP